MKCQYYYFVHVPQHGAPKLALVVGIEEDNHYCPPVIICLPAYLKEERPTL